MGKGNKGREPVLVLLKLFHFGKNRCLERNAPHHATLEFISLFCGGKRANLEFS